jgi:hypothetical protein
MSSGVAIAAVSTIGYLGFLIGPPLVGFLSSAYWTEVYLFFGGGVGGGDGGIDWED